MGSNSANEMTRKQLVVPETVTAARLDKYLGDLPDMGISRTRLQKLISDGLVTVDGQVVATKHLLQGGETIEILLPAPEETLIVGENLPLEVVFEDEYLAVVNKPAGMVTHPAVGNRSGTLVNALIHRFGRLASQGGKDRPGIVHRLDKDTSGLLVIARTDEAYQALQKAIQAREVQRTYLALICGHMREEEGTINLPMGRSRRDRTKMAVDGAGSREAVTEYRLIRRFKTYDLLNVVLGTGRTHQIRVHFSHLGRPIFGDPEYGGREKWYRSMFGPDRPLGRKLLEIMQRQALHASRLEFAHPITGEPLVFEVEMPEDFRLLLEALEETGS
jgi:23S rRNA pseudouridine1911/1915/1917 synthase